jgi:hypothetical protein
MTPHLAKGDKVLIIAGTYKSFGTGIYIRPYGTKMCCVEVHKVERNLRLTSIRKDEDEDGDKMTATTEAATADYELLVNKLENKMNALELRINLLLLLLFLHLFATGFPFLK